MDRLGSNWAEPAYVRPAQYLQTFDTRQTAQVQQRQDMLRDFAFLTWGMESRG